MYRLIMNGLVTGWTGRGGGGVVCILTDVLTILFKATKKKYSESESIHFLLPQETFGYRYLHSLSHCGWN